MGGDFGPQVTVPACLTFLKSSPHSKIILVGQQKLIERYLPANYSSRIEIVHASAVVSMNDKPSSYLKGQQDTSLENCISLLADKNADAAVSAGNTGAMMILGKKIAGCHPAIDRPALVAPIPRLDGKTAFVLDIGANVDCSADTLVQFAFLGATVSKALTNTEDPKVFLLNIGTESIKGSQQVRYADQMLQNKVDSLNYQGFLEANRLITGNADVVVCDGFSGNVLLKAIEGSMKLSLDNLYKAFEANLYNRLVGFLALPVLKRTVPDLDPRYKNGTLFVGLKQILIKAHGASDEFAFRKALETAKQSAESEVVKRVGQSLDAMMDQELV